MNRENLSRQIDGPVPDERKNTFVESAWKWCTVITLLISLGSIIFLMGINEERLDDHERRIAKLEQDHDVVTTMKIEIEMLLRHAGIQPPEN